MRTTGYKRQQAEFQDLLYETLRRAGAATSDESTMVPSGVQIGSGVKTVSTARVMTQGTLTPTEKEYDIAMRGEGFFRVQMPDGRTAYTRDGSFELDATGQLVTHDGYLVAARHRRAGKRHDVSISPSGQVQANIAGQTAPQTIGAIQLARFINKGGLESIGDNLLSRPRLPARR